MIIVLFIGRWFIVCVCVSVCVTCGVILSTADEIAWILIIVIDVHTSLILWTVYN